MLSPARASSLDAAQEIAKARKIGAGRRKHGHCLTQDKSMTQEL
jgi:hypothetical protein